MKVCPTCGQAVADEIGACPSCGRDVSERRHYIDDYRIVDVLHEGYSTFLCRAVRERTDEHVMIRLFTPRSGVDEEVAARLQREIEELKKLPGEGFVRHHAIRRSQEGLWYRISEWVETESWGSLLASGRLSNRAVLLDLFHRMAEILTVLHAHGHFIPHLILNDIMVVPGEGDALSIEIDYKLSRFIDPALDRPAPMLKKLLSCHPDIINQRPLDFRSDVWSLGKVFVELLSGDLEIEDVEGRVDHLNLLEDLAVLLRVMLAEDPDLRPQSMAEIAESLKRIRALPQERALEPLVTSPLPAGPFQRLQKRVRLLAAAAVVLLAAALFAWFYAERNHRDTESTLEGYANRYARSVGFILVDYWLKSNGQLFYRNVAEGTAFLVDRQGYMLTSRHVVCPWLEDPQFSGAVKHARMRNLDAAMGYRIYLWFEGTKAFNPAGRMIEGADLADVYFTENAFSTETSPRLEISGVAKPAVRTRQLFTSPLKDDCAVIKIEPVPDGMVPLPLDLEMDPRKLPKLSRVITLGFPLGSRTQTDTVNASVVRGNVRRAFENMFQIDASLHGGNSGGPVIDIRGKVIGIVSGVAVDFTQGLVPMVTPVWDIGLILPITGAVQLLSDLKAGQIKWNGVVDFSVEATLRRVRETAARGRYAEAMAAIDEKLEKGPQPGLVAAAGMLRFCHGDYRGARQRFTQALSMDPEDYQAGLMLVLSDWVTGSQDRKDYYQYLSASDWSSPAEFQGYLLQMLEGRVGIEVGINGWYSTTEKSWLHYIGGLVRLRQENLEEAQQLLETAVLAADPDGWEFFLARAKLDELRSLLRATLREHSQWYAYNAHMEGFDKEVEASLKAKKKRQEDLAPLWVKIAEGEIGTEEKLATLKKIRELDPDNRTVLGTLAYADAAADSFPEALNNLRAYLQSGGRETAMRLSLGLLEAVILHCQDRKEDASALLNDYARRTRDPWFLGIYEYLRGRKSEDSLRQSAGDSAEKILTAFTAAGFWAECSSDKKNAMRLYKEALGSLLDNWIEYDFVRERIKRLKRSST
ncbi:MAG: trypsin-like peptidase domain-containing protein [Thermodesulfobacteriota bacterium]